MDEEEFNDNFFWRLLLLLDEPVDPNTVAAFVDGQLTERELIQTAIRIARDPDTLLLVLALQDS